MKKLSILFILLPVFCVSLIAQSGGIAFNKGAWSEALKMAEKEDKLIFMDAYTTWCGPCKKMAKEVFPKKSVGEFFNENFINVKMDMENGEGVYLARTYNVTAFPTLLFIHPDGRLIHRAAGYHSDEQFLELGKVALDPSKSLTAMEKRFVSGDRNPEFLMDYIKARYLIHDGSHVEVADEYMKTQEDWTTDDNMRFIFGFVGRADSDLFNYMLDNKEMFNEKYGTKAVTAKIQQIIYASIQDSEEASSLEQIDKLFLKVYPEKAKEMSSRFRLSFYRQAGDKENYAASAIQHYKKFPSKDSDELNEVAWTFFRISDDKKLLKQAVKWVKKSIKLDSNYYNHDTLAALYNKLGKKKKAIKIANKAIGIAKENNMDFTPTQELLDKITAKT